MAQRTQIRVTSTPSLHKDSRLNPDGSCPIAEECTWPYCHVKVQPNVTFLSCSRLLVYRQEHPKRG
jgi:hypothetical protein